MDKIKPGLLIGQKATDYIAGEVSPIVRKELTDGDWRNYKPEHEIQFINAGLQNSFETSYCTVFSGTDVIESIFMYHLSRNNFRKEDVVWLGENGYFTNGFINFSERFTGIMAGLGVNGGYLYQIAESMRQNGLIPNSILPNEADSYAEYVNMDLITEKLIALGKEFKRRFPISYEWVPKEMAGEWLKYSPLHCTVKYARSNDSDEILDPQGTHNHAVMENFRTSEYENMNDSYWQEEKKYKLGNPDNFLAYYVKTKDMIFKKEKDNNNIYLINEGNRTKMMIVDMSTLNALDANFEEVDSLSDYQDAGTLIWTERIIN